MRTPWGAHKHHQGACVVHNLRLIRLVLAGKAGTSEHARLLAQMRECEWCRWFGYRPLVG